MVIQTLPPTHQMRCGLRYSGTFNQVYEHPEATGEECKFVCGMAVWVIQTDAVWTALDASGKKRIKTDRQTQKTLPDSLAFSLYSPVYVPTTEDDAVKEYIRMRDDIKADLKRVKQQIIAFTTRHGLLLMEKSYWTQKHLKWLETLVFEHPLYKNPSGILDSLLYAG